MCPEANEFTSVRHVSRVLKQIQSDWALHRLKVNH